MSLKKYENNQKKGRLIEQGTHEELRALGGLYSQLSELQEKGLATI